ncbi:hypothetical protein GWK47_010983 [Chionoecetes opilio]|uniref:Uncharacterized protein n=1 Tax=Chionoecetes opilio TaxID=41210 RepID=A0A8J5C2X7_CHIOP|nr:hypothetical protein GWK47_010983 [Chionoecetes opilio]
MTSSDCLVLCCLEEVLQCLGGGSTATRTTMGRGLIRMLLGNLMARKRSPQCGDCLIPDCITVECHGLGGQHLGGTGGRAGLLPSPPFLRWRPAPRVSLQSPF